MTATTSRSPRSTATSAPVVEQSREDWDGLAPDLLAAIGWQSSDGTPLTSSMASRALWETRAVLRRVGGLTAERGTRARDRPTPQGVAFARVALRVCPDSGRRG